MIAQAAPKAAQGSPRVRRRGLLDATLMVVLVYAVYARTPFGAVTETIVNIARGQKNHPSWFATFQGRETAVNVSDQLLQEAIQAPGELPAAVRAAAAAHQVDAEAVAALVSVHGACTDASCTLVAPDKLATFVPGKSGRVDVDTVARGLAAAAKVVGKDSELQIEALYTGPFALSLAVEQAKRSSVADPDDVELHAEFYSPSIRRGALQGALAVLAVHRLRTLAWPAETRFRVTSPFGDRIHPVMGDKRFHNGTDIGTPTGTPLLSAHDGAIKRASRDSVSGNYVIVDHGLGIETTYCHLSDTLTTQSERVRRRAIVGRSGATGRVTGPHLHYILRIHGTAVDAEQYGESPTRSGALATPVPLPHEPKAPPSPKPKPKRTGTSKKASADGGVETGIETAVVPGEASTSSSPTAAPAVPAGPTPPDGAAPAPAPPLSVDAGT